MSKVFNLGRILTGLATIAAVLAGTALGVPAVMDWDHLRAPVEARAGALLGAPVRIDGRITVRLLPGPVLSLGDVVVEPAPGLPASGDVARARVHLSLWPLLSGKAVPSALSLSGADVYVDRAALLEGAAPLHLPVTVNDGKVHFEPGAAAADITGLAFSAGPGREGQTRVRISGRFKESPFTIRATLQGGDGTALHSATLNFGEGDAVLSFVRAEAPAGEVDIRLKLTRGENAAAFLVRLLPSLGQVMRPEQAGKLGPLALTVRAVPEGGAFALKDLEITAGPLRLAGGGVFRPAVRPGVDIELGAQTLVLGGAGKGFDPSGLFRVLGLLAEWGGRFDGGLRLHADHVLAGGAILRDGEIRLTFAGEGTRLDRFRVSLPRGLSLSGRGVASGPGQLAALVRLEGARSTHLLTLLEAERGAAGQPENPLSVEGRLVLSGERAVLQDVRFAAGRNALRAEGALFFGERMAVELRVEAGALDLRSWGLAYDDLTPELSVDGLWGAARELAAQADITVRAEFGSLRLTDAELRDGVVDLALDPRQIVVRRLSVEEAGGRAIEARLRAPLTPDAGESGSGKENAEDWIAHAEAAFDLRPAQREGGGLAWRAGLWDGNLSIETDGPVRSRLSGGLSQNGGEFRWSEVSGRIGRASVHGQFSLSPGERPVLRGTINTDGAAIRFAGGTDGELWPAWPLSRFWPQGLDIHLDWSADSFEIAGATLSGASGTVVLEKGMARLTLVSGMLYAGAASGAASLKLQPEGMVAWEGQGVVQRADLAALMGGNWQGSGLVRLSTSGSGASIAEIVSGLLGTVTLNFEEGRIGGIDARALAASLTALDNAGAVRAAVEQAFGNGTTPFRRLEGQAKIRNGEVSLSGISAQAEPGPVILSGVVNLPARLIAAQADISLGDAGAAPLSVQFIGRMEAPERAVDTERLAKRLAR